MELSDQDHALVAALCDGLPLAPHPYRVLGARLGLDEATVIRRLQDMVLHGVIRRLGIIVRHHELGYRANAMVVWDIPDAEVRAAGHRLGQCPEVSLCYRRPRRGADWPYNLFTMVHGRDRASVRAAIDALAVREGLDHHPRAVLFSLRRFKQCGARYGRRQAAE